MRFTGPSIHSFAFAYGYAAFRDGHIQVEISNASFDALDSGTAGQRANVQPRTRWLSSFHGDQYRVSTGITLLHLQVSFNLKQGNNPGHWTRSGTQNRCRPLLRRRLEGYCPASPLAALLWNCSPSLLRYADSEIAMLAIVLQI